MVSGNDELGSVIRKLVENSYGFSTSLDAAKIFSVLGPNGKLSISFFSIVMVE